MRRRFNVVLVIAAVAFAGRAAAQTASPPPPASPLSFRFGPTELVIGGFVDATAIIRSTNVGSGVGTAFGSIPLEGTLKGNLSEMRMTAQNSRVSLTVNAEPGEARLRAYIEGDFLGTAPPNLNVTSGSDTFRMRLYWVQYRRHRFEFVAGQSWTLMTPNRTGVSPVPADIFYSQNADTNYQVGLTWARQTQFRFALHAARGVSAAVSFENPQQYVGPAVVLPAGFDASQVDTGDNANPPNRYPDVVAKIAFDPRTARTHQHVEVVGLLRGFRTYDGATATAHAATGRGVAVNANLEPLRRLHVIANTFLSDGGGRYIAGLGPDFVVSAAGAPVLVGARSAIGGLEAAVGRDTLVFGYISTARFDAAVGADDRQRPIGYGVAGATSANRRIDETTAGFVDALFRNASYGALQLLVQYSYATRDPWSVPASTPSRARAHIVYVDLRYMLP